MRWQSHQQQEHRIRPPALKDWLLDRGSLTERLVEASGGEFRVEVLRQQWGVADSGEARLLGLPLRQRALIREVILHGNNQPWVYARSILPAKSLQHSLRHLKRLGNKPLGAVLFGDPDMQRSNIEIACLNTQELPLAIEQPAWGRRSVFFLHNQPLLVSEVFLPAFVSRFC